MFQIKVSVSEPINDQNKECSEEGKAERHSVANLPPKAESNDHDRTRNEHYRSSQAYFNSMNCVSDLASRHTHLPNRVQPVPKDRVVCIAHHPKPIAGGDAAGS